MKRPAFVHHPEYEMDIGRHVFPTIKFRLVREALTLSGAVSESELELAPMPRDEDLLRVLTPDYLEELRSLKRGWGTARSELPLTEAIVKGCIRCAGGSIHAARRAISEGAACHLGGGFHHGFRDHAEGFCYINDVAIAACAVRAEGLAHRVAIIDTDVHQGNGTAAIFRGAPDVFTFSIHQENLYPQMKEISTLDIGLEDYTDDEEYLGKLRQGVARVYEEFEPDFVIYVGGVDTYMHDRLGDIKLTHPGMAERDSVCLSPAARRGIPFMTVFAGGYAEDVTDTVALHVQTVNTAIALMARATGKPPGRQISHFT